MQPPGQVHPLRGVDLDKCDAVPFARHLGEQFPGRPAVHAHLSRELNEGRPRPQGRAKVRGAQRATGRSCRLGGKISIGGQHGTG